jgi:pimeloyl-[acyl-carrier protein] synthase
VSVTGVAPETRLAQELTLGRLLEPDMLANPYPLFKRLRTEDPVHWDPFLHAWVVTRYPDVVRVLTEFSANRTFTPIQLSQFGLSALTPVANVMLRQMLFMDPPMHMRLRALCSVAFTPARVERLRRRIQELTDQLIVTVASSGRMDLISDFAAPLPAIITAEMLGVPSGDHKKLKDWSAVFAMMLGNFQHNPDFVPHVVKTVEEMSQYFLERIREYRTYPREGLVYDLMTADVCGDHLSDDEVVANTIVTMVGGQETTTNLIGNGMLTLLRNPCVMEELKTNPALIPSAVEEMLRYESPSQHTARLAPQDIELGDKHISKRQAVIAVMAAANRDPQRFTDPDRVDIRRRDNRHVAFGWGPHFCFGAALARIEGQIAFGSLLQRLEEIVLEPRPITWRFNLGLRGLTALPIKFRYQGDL